MEYFLVFSLIVNGVADLPRRIRVWKGTVEIEMAPGRTEFRKDAQGLETWLREEAKAHDVKLDEGK